MSYVSIDDVRRMSVEMAGSTAVNAFDPQAVIYVESAGRLIGYEIAGYFGIPVFAVKTTRAGGAVKNRVKSVFNMMPWQVSHYLRKIEMSSAVHKTFGEREVTVPGSLPGSANSRILLVDDAIDSGTSMKCVVGFLKDKGYHNLFTAVITTTSDNPLFEADYTHVRQLLTFPWSIGAKEYRQYQKLHVTLHEKTSSGIL